MSDANDKAIRLADGRPRDKMYSRQVKARARVCWVLTPNSEDVDKTLGLPKGTTRKWKHLREPDGQNWEEFREQLDISDIDRLDQALGPPGTVALHEQFIRHGRRLLAIAMTALEQGKLYDEEGNEVKALYTESGKRVPMGMRPENPSQVAKLFEIAERTVRTHVEAVESVHEAQQQAMREQGALYRTLRSEFEAAIKKVLGGEAWDKLDGALASGVLMPEPLKGDAGDVGDMELAELPDGVLEGEYEEGYDGDGDEVADADAEADVAADVAADTDADTDADEDTDAETETEA